MTGGPDADHELETVLNRRATPLVAVVATAGIVRWWRRGRASRPSVLDAAGVRRLYDRMAPLYDVATLAYQAVGAYRLADEAIATLGLQPGDMVVDLGTGTGRNLPLLAEAVGSSGRVVGVDVSPGMLERARRRVERAGVDVVELVEADIATYELPPGTSAVMGSFAMEMLPDYREVIDRLVTQLPTGGRVAVTGLRDPEGWPRWLVRLVSAINRPFGVSEAYRDHRPWEAVEAVTSDTAYVEMLGGAIYLAAGTVPERPR
ncbi:class I SAM-dependent methyltransferase [Euzebya sp.]|uniref:class I SAM-dependent methyltransferase n=1 Tax=Euzebya sp. TaxID=1971409 RepID=UPI0035146BFA